MSRTIECRTANDTFPVSGGRSRLLVLLIAVVLGIAWSGDYVSEVAAAIDDSAPWRVCVRDIKGLLPDPALAVASVERAFAEAQTHPGWAKSGRLSLPPTVSASCQDQPIIYSDGVVVQRLTHFVHLMFPYDAGIVVQPGPFDEIIFVLPDEEINEGFFWSDTGSTPGTYRHVVQAMTCSTPGPGARADRDCGETTGGLYVTAAEVLDSHLMALGLIQLHARRI